MQVLLITAKLEQICTLPGPWMNNIMYGTKVNVHVAFVSLKVISNVDHYLDFREFKGVIRVMKLALWISIWYTINNFGSMHWRLYVQYSIFSLSLYIYIYLYIYICIYVYIYIYIYIYIWRLIGRYWFHVLLSVFGTNPSYEPMLNFC